MSSVDFAAFQFDGGIAAESDCARVFLDGDSDYVAESADWKGEVKDQGDGQPLSVYLLIHLAGEVFQPR